MLYIPGYTLADEVACGKRSRVFKGFRDVDEARVIVKLSTEDLPTHNELSRIHREYEIGSQFTHDNVVRYLDLVGYQQGMAIVEEDFGGMALSRSISAEGLDPRSFLSAAVQLTGALAAIHKRHVIHRDIENRGTSSSITARKW